MIKFCPKCKQELSIEAFTPLKSSNGGFMLHCKKCISDSRTDYRKVRRAKTDKPNLEKLASNGHRMAYGQEYKNGYFIPSGAGIRLKPVCQDCHAELNPNQFAPIFEESVNGSVVRYILLCWTCYNGWCEAYLMAARERAIVTKAVNDIEKEFWRKEWAKTKAQLDKLRRKGFV